MGKLKLSEFNLFGTFCLTEAETVGITDLVQPLGNDKYLSRNCNYYPNNWDKISFCDLCLEYERLNALLPMTGKPAFVVCEKMHTLAVCAINTIQQNYRICLSQNGNNFDTVAQKCAQECADNLVRLIHNQTALKTATNLSEETYLHPSTFFNRRVIQSDNKKLLYMCANALPDDTEYLITPGRGSSKLGTLVQAVRKHKGLKPLGFTQINFSLYGNRQEDDHVFSQPIKDLPEKLLVFDDDLDTGRTLCRIKAELTKQGHQVTNGAMVTTFDDLHYNSFFRCWNWSNYIDIIPNLCGQYSDQRKLNQALYDVNKSTLTVCKHHLQQILTARDNNANHTADYLAMCTAEEKAHDLGVNLYKTSDNISPIAVAYNRKMRNQIKKYDAELQNSINDLTSEKF